MVSDILKKIGSEHLGVENWGTPKHASEDFYEVSIGGIRCALEEAYKAGQESKKDDGYWVSSSSPTDRIQDIEETIRALATSNCDVEGLVWLSRNSKPGDVIQMPNSVTFICLNM